jgi:hypothetical protein
VLSFSDNVKERAKKRDIVTMTPEEYISTYFAHSKYHSLPALLPCCTLLQQLVIV